MQKYLKRYKPNSLIVYFRADWNPHCDQSDRDIEKLAMNHSGI
jgi:thioredoxin-like negative regulator of GroEL